MAEYDDEKSLEATPHRRQRAREEGHVARSQDLASAVLLLLGLVALMLLGSRLIEALGRSFVEHLGGTPWLSADPEFVVNLWQRTVVDLSRYLLPILGLVAVAAVAANFLQVGFLLLPEKLVPDLTRLDPLQGLKRIFSLGNGVHLLFGLFKILVIGAVAWASLYQDRAKILGLAALPVPEIALYLGQILLATGLKTAVALAILAILDYGFQRWKHERDIRMTPQEVREEMRNLEGNPQVVARRRHLQRQLAMHRVTDAVPKVGMGVTRPVPAGNPSPGRQPPPDSRTARGTRPSAG